MSSWFRIIPTPGFGGVRFWWQNWRETRKVLRELQRQRMYEEDRQRLKIKDDLTSAVEALRCGNHSLANTIWNTLSERYPRLAGESPLAADVLIGLRRFDEAEQYLFVNQKKNPGNPRFAKDLILTAFFKGAKEEAAMRAATLRKQFPNVIDGFTFGSKALTEIGRLAEAEAVAKQAMRQFPENWLGYQDFARLAVHQQNWNDAADRWGLIRERFPEQFEGHLGQAQALDRLERTEEADDILKAAIIRFPTNSELWTEFARIAQRKGDIHATQERWKQVIRRFPQHANAYLDAAASCLAFGVSDEAETMLRNAITQFPDDHRPSVELAKLLTEQRKFDEAVDAWEIVHHAFPKLGQGYSGLVDALRGAGRIDEAHKVANQQAARS